MKFKHLTPDSFTDNPFQQPSMEGLWDDIKGIFSAADVPEVTKKVSSKQKDPNPYDDIKKAILFLDRASKKDIVFKTEPIKSNSFIGLLINDGAIIKQLPFVVLKEAESVSQILTKSVISDKRYLHLLEEVTIKCRNASSEGEIEQIYQEYKERLVDTPISNYKEKKLFGIPSRELVSIFGIDKQPLFVIGVLRKLRENQSNIDVQACKKEDIPNLIKAATIFVKVIEDSGALKTFNFYPAGPLHRGKVWERACDQRNKSAINLEQLVMYFQTRNRYPFVSSMTYSVAGMTLYAICCWVKLSLQEDQLSKFNN